VDVRYVGYKLRNQLAAIDFNKHRNRECETTADGQLRHNVKKKPSVCYTSSDYL